MTIKMSFNTNNKKSLAKPARAFFETPESRDLYFVAVLSPIVTVSHSTPATLSISIAAHSAVAGTVSVPPDPCIIG